MKTNSKAQSKVTIRRNAGQWIVTETVSTEVLAHTPNLFVERSFMYRWQARQYAQTRQLACK
jgi:hypothetical protein